MSKRASLSSGFQKLDVLSIDGRGDFVSTSIQAQEGPSGASFSENAPNPPRALQTANTEERLSTSSSTHNEQCLKVTGSDRSQAQSCDNKTVSHSDSLQNGQSERVPRLTANFTQVPNEVLRTMGAFEDPIDFMIYLHLYTYSYGFGRRKASMSQSQLERFTGAAKNTVKRSLDRLVLNGWIKLVDDYEHGRVSRCWMVKGFVANGSKADIGSNRDSVSIRQNQARINSVSKVDKPTVSKLSTYKESIGKQTQRNSLSVEDEKLRDYFARLSPQKKKESEWLAFLSLKKEFTDSQIADCLEFVLKKGTPGGGLSCHSPMAFLCKAFGQVLRLVNEEQRKTERAELRDREVEQGRLLRAEEERIADIESRRREESFKRTFPSEREQQEVIAKFAKDFPFLNVSGVTARSVAIAAWWESQLQAKAN